MIRIYNPEPISPTVNAEDHWRHRLERFRRPLYSNEALAYLATGAWLSYMLVTFAM